MRKSFSCSNLHFCYAQKFFFGMHCCINIFPWPAEPLHLFAPLIRLIFLRRNCSCLFLGVSHVFFHVSSFSFTSSIIFISRCLICSQNSWLGLFSEHVGATFELDFTTLTGCRHFKTELWFTRIFDDFFSEVAFFNGLAFLGRHE